ncbi:hypothetical protein LTR17_022899 [Elasticomyces elasticus]|nr:hypothetical protein LTR17_022899 [Elasticomyces elasticus]
MTFGGKKYLWGNMPAFDVLKLVQNEGETYAQDLSLLFAASGDLRNVIKTTTALPSTYDNTVSLRINDKDLDVVARNTILLLVAFLAPDVEAAVDCMLHVWYSAMITQAHCDLLEHTARPYIANVMDKISSKPGDALQRKTWHFKQCIIRLALPKNEWARLLTYVDGSSSVTAVDGQRKRQAIALAPERIDHRDRKALALIPAHRVCLQRFREDGILLPFGYARDDFMVPNPTLFQAQEWPLKDSADPLDGWHLSELLKTKYGKADKDIYGKLYISVRQMLSASMSKLYTHRHIFELYNLNATELPNHCAEDTFARIEVSNIADVGYLGLGRTVGYLGPLLQRPQENPHVTLITLFMNAMGETVSDSEQMRIVKAK